MFDISVLLIKMTVIAVLFVFMFGEALRRHERRAFWFSLALLVLLAKDIVLFYLLQRVPGMDLPTLGAYFGNLCDYMLPIGSNIPVPVEIFHHYFLVWNGLEMVFAVILQQVVSSIALGGRQRAVQTIGVLVNFFILAIFGVMAFGIGQYDQLSDMLPYYLWAAIWAFVQYLVLALRVFFRKPEAGLVENHVVRARPLYLAAAALSILALVAVNLAATRSFADLPFFWIALLSYVVTLSVLVLGLSYLRHGLDGQAIELEGRMLQQRLFREMGKSVAETLSMQPLLEMLAQTARETSGSECCGIFLVDEQGERVSVGALTGFFPPAEPVRIEENSTPEIILSKFRANRFRVGRTYIGEVAASGAPLFVRDNLKSKKIPQTGDKWFEIRSVMALPLLAKGKVYGVLVALNAGPSGFTRKQECLSRLLADEAGPILRQLHSYQRALTVKQAEREFAIALDIQRKLMPQEFPEQPGVEIAAFSRIAKEGGGDYYDLLDFGDGRYGFVCADIAGKGVAASLVMVIIRSVIRSNALPGRDASEVVSIVNNTVSSEVGEERFASLYYYLFDVRHRTINYCNAGHTPLLLYRADHGSFARLDTEGMPIGIELDVEYGQASCSLQPGDVAVLFTDGVVEAMNEDLEQFGLDRLKQTIRENNDLSARELTDKIYGKMTEFVGKAEQHDDATLLLMKVT